LYNLNLYNNYNFLEEYMDKAMNAAFFYGPNNIKIKNINIENKSNDNLILKVLSCSICSYDVRTFRNGSFKIKPPIILGHEICAETIDHIEGKNFRIKPNSRVSVYPVIPCFNCWYCNHSKYNLCSNLKEIGSTVNGGFAGYISIPKKVLEIGGIIPVLDNVTNEEASLIEPLACCINGINHIKSLDFESIFIIGDGPIGLMQLMLLKKYFTGIHITVVGKIDHRLDEAKKLGADSVYKIDTKHDLHTLSKIIDELNNREKSPNLIFVSNNNAYSLKVAFGLANKNGKVIIFSGLKDVSSVTENNYFNTIADANFVHYNQISVIGSFSSNPENLREAMGLVNSEEIRIKNLITNTFELQNLENALKTSESFEGFKSVINKFDN